MALTPGFLDELRSRVSIAQVVGRSVTWDSRKSNPAKGDYWAPCPFHQERSASFHVDDAKGYYYCFGCHAKGDAVTFLRETQNLDFLEAMEILARDAGMTMPVRDAGDSAKVGVERALAEVMEAAVRFYQLQLGTAHAADARAYLARRGVQPGIIQRFELGFAPDHRTSLQTHLVTKGFSLEMLVSAGLVGRPQYGGSPYDRFRGRVMFPIRDARGRAIAFGARALAPGQEPKYLNSPETPLFDKGRCLYNAGPARTAAAKAGTVVVTEGYMDVIALAEAGIDHAVAPLGTAVTEDQLIRIWRIAAEPIIALDGDRAGLGAAQRLIDLALPLLEPGRALRFALLPPGQDPDDVVRTGGAEAITAILDTSMPMIELLWRRETEGQVLDSPERRRALDLRLRAHMEKIPDLGLRAHYEAELKQRRATLFARPSRAVSPARGLRGPGDLQNPKRGQRLPVAPSPAALASALGRPVAGLPAEARVRECAILAGCINHPEAARACEDRLERMAVTCPDLAPVRDALLSALARGLNESDTRAAVADRMGRDPLPELTAQGFLAANGHLRPGARAEDALKVLEEILEHHLAWTGRQSDVAEATRELGPDTADSIGWRLREAAEAIHQAAIRPLEAMRGATDEDSAWFEIEMRRVLTEQAAKKPRRP